VDIDRLVKMVEAEVRRLLEVQATGPPPETIAFSQGAGRSVLLLALRDSPAQDLLNRLKGEGKQPVVWEGNLSAIEDFEEIWLANLKWSDVAKIALGIFDTPQLEAILNALSSGKEVIAEPLQISPQCPPVLADLLKSYWTRLLSFGIKTPQTSGTAPSSSRTIVTQEDIREAKERGLQILTLSPRAIVTDMARDLAERLGIQIREEEQS